MQPEALEIAVPDRVDRFPGDRQQRRILFHDGLGLVDQRQALGGIDFPIDLRRQRLEFLVVPERVVLRAVLAVPGVEIVGGIDQGRHDGPDRQVEMPARGVFEPH